MRRRHLWYSLCVLVAFTTFTGPVTAVAWDDEGHMVVAALAYGKLTPTVKARADALVKLNPQYKSWVTGVPKAQQAKVAFMRAATWPDFIKRAKGYQQKDDPTGSNAARNIGYSDKLKHGYWHYEDLPFSPDGTPSQNPATPNAETQIDAFRTVLTDPNASDGLKSYVRVPKIV